MKPIVLSIEAEQDLVEIGRYIALDHPERALSFIDELERKAAKACERPLSYRERRDISPGLRAVQHGSYMIFFRDLIDEVRIVRIVHGARDLTALFS